VLLLHCGLTPQFSGLDDAGCHNNGAGWVKLGLADLERPTFRRPAIVTRPATGPLCR
jgi:hypothetical protein